MASYEGQLRRLREGLGDFVARHESQRDLSEFGRYADNPVAFMREVLKMDPWEKQAETAAMVRDNRLSRVRSAQGVGKTYVTAGIVLWWLYARGPSAVVTLAPTDRQVKELLWGEIRSAFLRADDLPGELFQKSLRISDADRHFAVGFSTNDAGRLTGFHHPNLLVVADEAHGLDPFTWEAMFALATGEQNKILAIGNPHESSGKWYDVNRSSEWAGLTISALDHPNVQQGKTIIPGAVSSRFVEDMRREYGEPSSVYQSRVLGEFPDEEEDGLVRRSWLFAAARRFERQALHHLAEGKDAVAAVDVARYGADSSCVAIRRGPVLAEVRTWHHKDTMESTGRVIQTIREYGIVPEERKQVPASARGWLNVPYRESGGGRVIVDEVGVGAGVLDRLKEKNYKTRGYNGGRSSNDDRFLNRRAETFWTLRKLLEGGSVAIVPDPKLAEELVALRWSVTSSGKVAMEPKDDLKVRLGRSPDRADAVAMAFDGLHNCHRIPRLSSLHW